MWLILLALVLEDVEAVSGTYTLDRASLREITIEKLEGELGTTLNEAQLAAVDEELEKLEVSLTLEPSGKVTYTVSNGIENETTGQGRWQLEGAELTLRITHQYGLRLERKQLITGTFANFTIFTRLGDDLPMVTLKKQPATEPDP